MYLDVVYQLAVQGDHFYEAKFLVFFGGHEFREVTFLQSGR